MYWCEKCQESSNEDKCAFCGNKIPHVSEVSDLVHDEMKDAQAEADLEVIEND